MYYRRDGTVSNMREWATMFERKEERIVQQSYLPNGIFVSTVFLGLDHSFGDGPPLIFESMAFAAEEQEFTWPEDLPEDEADFPNGKWLNERARELNSKGPRKYHPDLDQVRYSTEAEALAGHLAMCERFFAGSRLLAEVASDGRQAQKEAAV